MATNDPILHLLQAQGATGLFDSEGQFQINREALKDRYGALLENDYEAILFFAQFAQRWKAEKLDLKVLKKQFRARFQLPEQSIVLERLRPNPTRVLEAFFPQDHPLYELAMGYNILTYSELTENIEVSLEENCLCVHWSFHSKRSLLSSTRSNISFLLMRRLLPKAPLSLGGREHKPQSFPSTFLHGHFSFGDAGVPRPVIACQKDVLKAWAQEPKHIQNLEVSDSDESEWMMLREEFPGPVFFNQISNRDPIVYFFSSVLGGKGPTLVPVRYGVPLQSITLDEEFGTAVVFVNVENLTTDLSGMKLVQDEAYQAMIEDTLTYLRTKLRIIKSIEQHYQPKVERREVFKKGLTVSLLTPPTITLGIMLGGAGAILKSALVLKAVVATSPVGILAYARTIVDPSHHTRSLRKTKFGWLKALPEDPSAPLADS